MAGVKGSFSAWFFFFGCQTYALILLALSGSIGLLFLVLGCALPQYNEFLPLIVLMFYFLCPIPLLIANRYRDDMSSSSALQELALFLTTVIVVSAFALPIVLAHAKHSDGEKHFIAWGAAALIVPGNIFMFGTILAYFIVFREDDGINYSLW